MLPIMKIKDQVFYPWKGKPISLKTWYHHGGGYESTKSWGKEKIYGMQNTFGQPWNALFLAPYKRIYTMRGATYKIFTEYTTD